MPFIRGFLAKLGDTESAQYTDNKGNPTQALITRIKSALFAKAYDDDRLLEMMADVANPELQNILNALSKSAPKFIKARATAKGDTQDLSEKVVDGIELALDQKLKNAVTEATNLILQAKINNQPLAEFVKQLGLFENIEPEVIELALFLAKNVRSTKKMSEYLGLMAEYISQDNINRQNENLFGEPEPLKLSDVMIFANQKLGLSSPFMNKEQDLINDLLADNVDVQENQSTPTPSSNDNQDDVDYLNRIIHGEVDPLETDDDRLIEIGERLGADNPLFIQVVDIIEKAVDKLENGE